MIMITHLSHVPSWVGSVNGFLVVSGGLLAGRLYDRGYLYVRFFVCITITENVCN